MPIGITGGTGFIGQRLVKRLLQEGQELRLLVRNSSCPGQLSNLPVEISRIDLQDLTSLERALNGCERLYHLAAYAKNWAPEKNTYFKINVRGFKNLLEACLMAGVQRVVYVSSSVVSGPSQEKPVSELNTRQGFPFLTEYEESKARSEEIIPDFLARGLEVITARPTRVYGPGLMSEANSVTRLIRYYLKFRTCLVLSSGQQVGNYVYVDDIVEGLKLLMSAGRNGEAYILGGENISLSGFYQTLREVSGRRALKIRIPVSLALAIARLETWKAQTLGRYPLITEGWVKTFLQNWAASHQKASRELGYQPRSLKEGLRLTCEWLGYRTAN
ncbi:MAG: NAD-dependent epimerase/dehydratase family protein [Acidobacteriota bacterium]|nr:NAD-dependent epimerase/dehydratase family protein [Acidobacteriota bacterium]MDW3229049.1 NAD-dependent epimerase/dehydratase family protein [Acidobacteriota bacterium]